MWTGWIETRRLRAFADDLRRVPHLLGARYPTVGQGSPASDGPKFHCALGQLSAAFRTAGKVLGASGRETRRAPARHQDREGDYAHARWLSFYGATARTSRAAVAVGTRLFTWQRRPTTARPGSRTRGQGWCHGTEDRAVTAFRFYCLDHLDRIIVGDPRRPRPWGRHRGRLPRLPRSSAVLDQSDRGLAGGKPALHKPR